MSLSAIQIREECPLFSRLVIEPEHRNRGAAVAAGVPGIAPRDLRRTCAKLCRAAGGELEQIQLLLGHASVQTTERYLGTKQDLVHAPNDGIKLKLTVQDHRPTEATKKEPRNCSAR